MEKKINEIFSWSFLLKKKKNRSHIFLPSVPYYFWNFVLSIGGVGETQMGIKIVLSN